MSRLIQTGQHTIADEFSKKSGDEKLIITKMKDRLVSVYLKKDRILDAFLEDEGELAVSEIRMVRVDKVHKNMNGCFVRLNEKGEMGYLSGNQFSEGDILPVEIITPPLKTKPRTVTNSFSLSGKYLVLKKADAFSLSFSKKLNKKAREKIKGLLPMEKLAKTSFSITCRTKCRDAKREDVSEEFIALSEQMNTLCMKAACAMLYQVLQPAKPLYQSFLDSYPNTEQLDIVTDIFVVHNLIRNSRLYEDEQISLSTVYGISSKIDHLLNKKVQLKSGAYLVIEQTEAFVSIDVNSGKKKTLDDMELYFLQINKEALKEALYQISVRQLSGMVLIDFINLKNADYIKLLQQFIHETVEEYEDISFVDLTGLFIGEFKKKKKREPLADSFLGFFENR